MKRRYQRYYDNLKKISYDLIKLFRNKNFNFGLAVLVAHVTIKVLLKISIVS